MATAFPSSVSAVQVGSYFVRQYYQVLQQQPNYVHQFYTDASTMLRIDGDKSESASAMLQIHSLIMALSFTEIEIKTAHSLDSLNGGVLVMVSGSVQTKEYVGRRKFAQTFFLAPQEKGYFVLNDIFHFLEEEPIREHPAAVLTQNHFDSKLDASSQFVEPDVAVSDYVQGGETQSREFVDSTQVEENDIVDQYSPSEKQEEQLPESEEVEETPVEETPVEEPTPQYMSEINTVQDSPPAPVEEPVVEPTKHTYASILRVARGQSALLVAPKQSVKRSVQSASEWNHAPQPSQQAYPALATGSARSGTEAVEEVATFDEEGDGRSVYVRNLSSTTTSSEIEEEFKNFGRIKPGGVIIRNRKEGGGVYYAFVEFEEVSGAQNAIQASPLQLSECLVHIVERRPNSSSSVARGGRGRGGGRGRAGYSTEAPRGGRFSGRGYGGRGNGQDGDYNNSRPSRGNGYHQRGARQEKGILGNQASPRNEQNTWN